VITVALVVVIAGDRLEYRIGEPEPRRIGQ